MGSSESLSKKLVTIRVPCPICQSDGSDVVRSVPPYAIVRCRRCGLTFLSPRPAPEAIRSFYENLYFESGSAAAPGYASYDRMANALRREATKKLDVVANYLPPPGRILDHGCGTGVFLEAAIIRGYDAIGVDVSHYAIESLVCERGLPAEQATLEANWGDDASFDVITSWDVIEHIADPMVTLQHVCRLLKPGGVYLATTPDIDSVEAHLLGRRWYGFTKVPEHLSYFSHRTIAEFLRQAGLELVVIRPWGFVRDVAFLIDKVGAVLHKSMIQRLAERLTKTSFGQMSAWFPVTDMLVVVRRPKSS